MIFKNILRGLSISLLTSFVLASNTNDCNEINEYLNKKYTSLYENTIDKCEVNEQGKVILLKVNNYELKEEDVNKILSYDTIKDLEEEEDAYEVSPKYNLGYSKYPIIISKLPELENLIFQFDNTTYVRKSSNIYHQNPIEDDNLKLPKKLKKLTISQVILSDQNMKELSTLTNLEEL
ncbi:hypothetical protein PIROE2DRAFT_10413 [Piromyces sp. E2]|nr:hypothetical protein PIROE2DRAFT_10413 [Piromyces sp. E2]|eukprot:OUM63107.1 hypothetical protein PIROE2DRAFT_10413 [Piromyces sp. E2]